MKPDSLTTDLPLMKVNCACHALTQMDPLRYVLPQSTKVKHRRKTVNKTPRDIIGAENVTALKQAGFVVVRLSELSKLRANVKSVLDILSRKAPRNDRV